MRLTLGELRRLVREGLGGSRPEEAYEGDLMDDPAIKKQSKLVPDDIKSSIRSWTKKMGLSRTKKRSRPT